MTLIPLDRRTGSIWLNGALVPWSDARIHVLSHGLHYAGAVFEGERAYGGRVFRLAEHGRRLLRSCAVMDMACPWTAEQLDAAVEQVIAANGIGDGYVRRIVWRGSEMLGVAAPDNSVNVAIAAWDWPSYFTPEARSRGIRLQTAHWRRPHPQTAPTEAKAACLYAICTLAKQAAMKAGFDDALLLDWRGGVAEATGANIFFVREGRLHTPAPDGFLDGITRQTVIELARRRGVEVVERPIAPEELPGFEGCFLTGSAAEVTPVRAIDGQPFEIGALPLQMAADYASLVRNEAGSRRAA